MTKTHRISISVPADTKRYLDEHPDINRSKLFRNAVEVTQHPLYRQLHSTITLNLITTLSIIAGFLLLFLIQYIAFIYILITWVIVSALIIGLTVATLKTILRRKKDESLR